MGRFRSEWNEEQSLGLFGKYLIQHFGKLKTENTDSFDGFYESAVEIPKKHDIPNQGGQ